jgi:hypothetical protein
MTDVLYSFDILALFIGYIAPAATRTT